LNEELGQIVQAIQTHVQTVFNWEQTKGDDIDACLNIAELQAVSTKYV
jgi:hypothetical protein